MTLPPIGVSTNRGHCGYDARYTTDETKHLVPVRLFNELLADLQTAAAEAHTTLGLRDLSRMDFMVDDEGTCWFIDVNVMLGMTDTSLLLQTADVLEDLSFARLCTDIVDFVVGGRDVHSATNAFNEQDAGAIITEDAEATKE